MIDEIKQRRHMEQRVEIAARAEQNLQRGDDEYIVSRMTSVLTDRRWLTQAGNYVYPEDMTQQHLTNTIALLRKGGLKRPGCSGRSNAEWLAILEEEALRRGLKLGPTAPSCPS